MLQSTHRPRGVSILPCPKNKRGASEHTVGGAALQTLCALLKTSTEYPGIPKFILESLLNDGKHAWGQVLLLEAPVPPVPLVFPVPPFKGTPGALQVLLLEAPVASVSGKQSTKTQTLLQHTTRQEKTTQEKTRQDRTKLGQTTTATKDELCYDWFVSHACLSVAD